MTFKFVHLLGVAALTGALLLQGCGQDQQAQPEIKAAPKLSHDATAYAAQAWQLINQVDPLVYSKEMSRLENEVRVPARKLSTDWRINVKMTDSVTEGKYALCRKALTSLEIWARTTLEGAAAAPQKQLDYERDKQQCADALQHPEFGNTDPKQKGNAVAKSE